MISFFKNKKININAISFPTFDWEIRKDETYFKQWVNNDQTLALSINYFDSKPDLPYLDNIDVLREFYRKELSAHNGGLIEVDMNEINSFTAIKSLFKIKQAPTGVSYLASLTFPFKHHSFVIKIQAIEKGMTSKREIEVKKYLEKNDADWQKSIPDLQWESDPYKKEFKEGFLMHVSDQEKYDNLYANHALTKARSYIGKIEMQLIFDPELNNLKRLKK